MKEPYRWNYTIKVKTKEGTFEYEKETLDNIDMILAKHPSYEEVQATHNKPLVKTKRMSRNIQPRNKGLKK